MHHLFLKHIILKITLLSLEKKYKEANNNFSLHHVIISWPFYLLKFPLYKKTDVSKINEMFKDYLTKKQTEIDRKKTVKKTIKVIIPIVVVLALIIIVWINTCGCWKIFI